MEIHMSRKNITREEVRGAILATAKKLYNGREAPLRGTYNDHRPVGAPGWTAALRAMGYASDNTARDWALLCWELTNLRMHQYEVNFAPWPEDDPVPDMVSEAAHEAFHAGLNVCSQRTVGNKVYSMLR